MRRLFLDLETSMIICWAWRCARNTSIGHHQILEDSKIICVSYMWEGDSSVTTLTWDDKQCDKTMLEKLREVLLEADSVVGQNSESFDMRVIQKRMAYHNIEPVGQLSTDDTMKQAKKHFLLDSYTLEYMCKYFGLEHKSGSGGYKTWLEIREGSKEALQRMVEYCEHDVLITSQLWEKMAKYINPKQSHTASDKEHHHCPACGSEDMMKYGIYRTRVGTYQKRRCNKCLKVTKDSSRIKD